MSYLSFIEKNKLDLIGVMEEIARKRAFGKYYWNDYTTSSNEMTPKPYPVGNKHLEKPNISKL